MALTHPNSIIYDSCVRDLVPIHLDTTIWNEGIEDLLDGREYVIAGGNTGESTWDPRTL
jgi:hypothetical protein